MTLANVTISSGSTTLTNETVSGNLTLSGGTANGVAYLNTSKVVTTGSDLVFTSTGLGIGTTSPSHKLVVVGANSSTTSPIIKVSSIDQSSGAVALGDGSSSQFGVGIARVSSANAFGAGGLGFYTQDSANSGGFYWYAGAGGFAGQTKLMTLDASGNLAVGLTSYRTAASYTAFALNGTTGSLFDLYAGGTRVGGMAAVSSAVTVTSVTSIPLVFSTADTERARIDSSGNLLFAKTAASVSDVGILMLTNGRLLVTSLDQDCLVLNRQSTDGVLAEFRHANTTEGDISISGTTVSYNGGHLSRWAQTTTVKDESLVKGTVLSNLNEMNVYTDADGNPVDNEQLNKVKVSDVEGDSNVAGVFVNWSHDEDHNVDEINMAMTGDMIIRIAQGTTVQRGDLLMSAGDGTAKPQGDDIVRSKTVAKVTSTHITCTYEDGSYCVPCVLMAC
jgi:hypothetical protein